MTTELGGEETIVFVTGCLPPGFLSRNTVPAAGTQSCRYLDVEGVLFLWGQCMCGISAYSALGLHEKKDHWVLFLMGTILIQKPLIVHWRWSLSELCLCVCLFLFSFTQTSLWLSFAVISFVNSFPHSCKFQAFFSPPACVIFLSLPKTGIGMERYA